MLQTRNFVYDHLRKTTGGLIIQNMVLVNVAIYVEMQQGCLKISKFDSGSKNVVWISCNGLVLTFHVRERHFLYVTNPVTKQWLRLPPCIHTIGCRSDCALTFVEASMEYKVVVMHGPKTYEKQIILLTVGVDNCWRNIDTEHFSITTRRALEFDPIVTVGFIHWITRDFVLTFNVETETFRHSLVPPFVRTIHSFLPMGSDLSFISATREFLWDVWEMNSQTGEWTMLLSIDLEVQRCQLADMFCEHEDVISELIPAGWLVMREVLVFSLDSHPRLSIVCNVKTGEIQSFELEGGTSSPPFYRPHVNSLVWLDGDSLREMENYQLLTQCPPILQR